ncbi:MAG: cyclase family protein [Atribacterota bacterium]
MELTYKHLKPYEERIRKVEFIIINTGWSKYWTTQKYYSNYPFLSCNAAKWLTKFNLKGVGIDTISIDKSGSEFFDTHKILLSKNIIIIENLTNLGTIESNYFTLSVLPIKYQHSDGSPVRAVAIENNC